MGVSSEGRAPWDVLPWHVWGKVGVLVAAFVALFHDWLWTQIQLSRNELEDWGHAFVVPLISLAMVWQRRAEVLSTPARTFWPGVLPLVLGVACYFFFVVGISNHMLQGFAMILTIAGVALLTCGPALFRYLFLPIAFLVFAVKISPQIMTKMTFPLQLLASDGAYVLLRMIGSPGNWFFADVQGNVLHITYRGQTHPLNVAEACSGMRMVIAFLALAAAVALFACRHWWQRIALLLLAVPVALFMNVIRVAVLGLASLWDVNLASGNAHMLIGTLLLVPGMFLFLGVVWALEKTVSDGEERRS